MRPLTSQITFEMDDAVDMYDPRDLTVAELFRSVVEIIHPLFELLFALKTVPRYLLRASKAWGQHRLSRGVSKSSSTQRLTNMLKIGLFPPSITSIACDIQ
jgi:hypothetical protein